MLFFPLVTFRDGRNASGIGGERRGGATLSRGASERFAQEEEAIPEANALSPMRLLASLIFSLQENVASTIISVI